MKRIAIYAKKLYKSDLLILEALLSGIQEKGWTAVLELELSQMLQSKFQYPANPQTFETHQDLKQGYDLLISLGGDGTFLKSVSFIRDSGVPILGINTGRLGFLATLSPPEISTALDTVLQGNYRIENRSLVSVESEIDFFDGKGFGLNEVGIMKTDTSSMITIKAFVDGNYLNSYWADGLIVSTATGSTGYSLAVGGPLVIPSSDIFIIAPMSPHNLNVRPLLVSSSAVLTFEVSSRSKNFLISLDSRSKVIDSHFKIEVKKAPFSAKLIKIPGDDFLQTLRSKLNWGLDVRN